MGMKALASKTPMDNMEAEAHASFILATDFDQPLQAEDVAMHAPDLRGRALTAPIPRL